MNKHRAKHRRINKRVPGAVAVAVRHMRLIIPGVMAADKRDPARHMRWIIPGAVAVAVGASTVAWATSGPTPDSPTQPAAATSATPLPRLDPATAEKARAYLDALGDHKVAVEPHQAVFLGEAVCAQRRDYNASLASLQAQLRIWMPDLRPLDAATLVDDADKHLCEEKK